MVDNALIIYYTKNRDIKYCCWILAWKGMDFMKSKIVTICLLVVYLLLPFLILYLCSLQMAIGYDAQFSTLYPQYIGVIIYLLPLLNGVLYGVLLFLCMKKGQEWRMAIFAVISFFWMFWGMNYCSLLPFRCPLIPGFDWMADARNLYECFIEAQWCGAYIAAVFLVVVLLRRLWARKNLPAETNAPCCRKISKGTVTAICLLAVCLVVPLLIYFLYSQKSTIAYYYSHLFRLYSYLVSYLVPLLQGVLTGVLLFLCMKKGREGLLALFTAISAFWMLWGMNIAGYLGVEQSFLSGFLWFDWMQDGLKQYTVSQVPVDQFKTIVAVMLLAVALLGRRKQKNI